MYLFDTNIFLEILLNQEEAQSCQTALTKTSQIQSGWLTTFSLHAIEAIVSRTKQYKVLEEFLSALDLHPHLFCYATTIEEELEAAHLAPSLRLDFDDALQYYVAHKKKLTLVTLDRDFSKLHDIQVCSPRDLYR